MKAIETKYHGPTNRRGSRIVASDGDGNRATISYPYQLSGEAVHRAAAVELCRKMGWSVGRMIGGATKHGYAFVFDPAVKETENTASQIAKFARTEVA